MQRWNSKFISSSHRLRLLAASGSALFGRRASPESFTCSCLLSQCLQSADSSSAQATEKNLIHISSEVRSTNTSLLQQNIQVPVLYLTVLTLLKKYIYINLYFLLFSHSCGMQAAANRAICASTEMKNMMRAFPSLHHRGAAESFWWLTLSPVPVSYMHIHPM